MKYSVLTILAIAATAALAGCGTTTYASQDQTAPKAHVPHVPQGPSQHDLRVARFQNKIADYPAPVLGYGQLMDDVCDDMRNGYSYGELAKVVQVETGLDTSSVAAGNVMTAAWNIGCPDVNPF